MTEHKPMADPDRLRRAELERMLASYGSDPARWPTAAQSRLADFIATNPQAAKRIEAERAFERLIAASRTQPVPDGLADRIIGRLTEKQVAQSKPAQASVRKSRAPESAPMAAKTSGRATINQADDGIGDSGEETHNVQQATSRLTSIWGTGLLKGENLVAWIYTIAMTVCLGLGVIVGLSPGTEPALEVLVQTVAVDHSSAAAPPLLSFDDNDDVLGDALL